MIKLNRSLSPYINQAQGINGIRVTISTFNVNKTKQVNKIMKWVYIIVKCKNYVYQYITFILLYCVYYCIMCIYINRERQGDRERFPYTQGIFHIIETLIIKFHIWNCKVRLLVSRASMKSFHNRYLRKC